MNKSTRTGLVATVATLGFSVACSDATPIAAPEGANVEFGIQRDPGGGAQVANVWSMSAHGQGQAVERDTVASLTITVESLQVLPLLNQNAEEDDAAWISVALDQPVTIDLTTLPTTDESPLVLASGNVAEGGYTNVRLFVSDAVIVFKGPLSLGAAITFDGNVAYDVTIPSADQTGIKTNLAFNALADTQVTLVFDETASYANVTLTGNGGVILAPVVRSPSGNGS